MARLTSSDSLPLLEEEIVPTFRFEKGLMRDGFLPVAGVDEAGRGPLAGPVVASAVILDPRKIPKGLNDSKQLTAARREELYEEILATADVAISSLSAIAIDRTNILRASLEAMRRAVASLPKRAKFVLIDGRDVPPGLTCPGKALVKGDARSFSIAAASIVAKVTRDRMMQAAGITFPQYGFEQHAGYATEVHREAITIHGPCAIHRMTFSPFRLME
ncbi:ribonuclease HII [Rhizobium sp. LjRoot254]|uniref:ribonuclease HII n=1 Tax=Rhizobium sp. LjRoot254 TaxID=3342297 RepID=UPI003ECC778F